jgi:hypothetical protein
MLTPGFANVPSPAVCAAIGGQPLAATAPTPCIVNTQATNVADLTTKGRFGLYNVAFGEDVDIYGLSYSRNIGGTSVAAELSYRDNMPLVSDIVQVLPAPLVQPGSGAIATTAIPESGTPGALGETMHGLVNVLGVIGQTPLFDTANWSTELTWMTWLDVSQNEAVFKGRRGYDQIDAVDKNYFGLAANFTPTWFQVFPGVDILAPLSWSQGISGNAAVTAGGNDGSGTFGIGVAADIRQKYRVDLKYVGFYGDYSKCPRQNAANPATCVDGAMDLPNGVLAILSDRDFVALTFKVTF